MRQMDQSALAVPDVFAADANRVIEPQRFDTWGQVDVVNYHHGLSGGQADEESLVPDSVNIVGKLVNDRP